MPQRIGKREDVADALWRLIHADLVKAQAELGADGRREDRIHRVRQRLKRSRSLLRALKPALGENAAGAKRALAAAARLLAGARDADAAAASARDLRSLAQTGTGFDRIVEEFDRKATLAHRETTPVDEVRQRLAIVAADLKPDASELDAELLLSEAIVRAYRRGRHAMSKAEKTLAMPDLHHWRKSVKDLWHLLRLARERLPKPAEKIATELKRLGETLGHDHDHAMLAERLALRPTGDPALMQQLAIIAGERRVLEREAFALGGQIYRRKAKRFAHTARLD